MDTVEIPIRAPTGRAWLTTIVCTIIASELSYGIRGLKTSRTFGLTLDRVEVFAIAGIFGFMAIAATLYLITLHVRPGNLTIQSDGLTRRLRTKPWHWHSTRAPLAQWHVHVTYFSESDRDRGVFKRLQLGGPGISEVILFSDVKNGAALIAALAGHEAEFGTYTVKVESSTKPTQPTLDTTG